MLEKITFKPLLAGLAVIAAITANANGDDRRDSDECLRFDAVSSVSVLPPWVDPVYDASGSPTSDPNGPVYSDAGGHCNHKFLITSPHGAPVTLREWHSVEGVATVQLVNNGTQIHLKLQNLQPHGVYTVWIAGFQPPGTTPDFSNLAGVGALGKTDGSQNRFVASAHGEAEFSILQHEGPYSAATIVSGAFIPSSLFDLGAFQILGAYHPDGQTHGPVPGDAGCGYSVQFAFNFPHDPRDKSVVRNMGGVVPLFLRTKDSGGNLVALPSNPDPSTLLWESRFGNPVVAPNGHQVTWGDYSKVEAGASATCVRDGTLVHIHAKNLIPNATYTIWTLAFNGPFPADTNPANPLDPNGPAPFGNLVGIGALGLPDGSQNVFHSSSSGEGEITAVMPPGPLSTSPPWLTDHYDVAGCLLNEVEFHLVAVYHFDGMSYGPTPGYQHGAVEQFGVQMKP